MTDTTTTPERRCNWCGLPIWSDKQGAWVDTTDGDGCENNPDGHQPEPTDRDFWQEGSRGDTLWLDETVTMPDSPVSVTFRHVLGYGLVNSNDEPVTYDLTLYRTYHAAGTNVPDDGPWHLTGEPRTGWQTQEAAQAWAEKGSDTVAWDFDNDSLYKARVELVTATRHAQAARDDRLAIDKIATLLGTAENWDGAADFLDDIARIIGRVRPSVGQSPEEFAGAFLAATGHVVDHEFDQRD